jgi:hypothetical protein
MEGSRVLMSRIIARGSVGGIADRVGRISRGL